MSEQDNDEQDRATGDGAPQPAGDAPPGEYYDAEADIRYYFDPTLTKRAATCEGGAAIEGSNTAARVTYVGFTTGRRFDQGDPPWRWIEMIGRDPDSPAEQQLVWCEEAFLFFEDESD